MKFNDIGIIISLKNYSENSLILKLFSKKHGIYRGFINSQKTKKTQAIFQVGNLVTFEWRSRIEESLGQFYYVDLQKSYTANFIFDKLKLNCCSSLFSMLDNCFLERENQEELFEKLHQFLNKITDESIDKTSFVADYIRLELEILKSLGYGVDLGSCVVTDSVDDLVFVSPKSARAVCQSAGEPYRDKLLKLPEFLLDDSDYQIDHQNLYEGLKLSGYFLEKFIFAEKNIRPANRNNIELDIKKTIDQS